MMGASGSVGGGNIYAVVHADCSAAGSFDRDCSLVANGVSVYAPDPESVISRHIDGRVPAQGNRVVIPNRDPRTTRLHDVDRAVIRDGVSVDGTDSEPTRLGDVEGRVGGIFASGADRDSIVVAQAQSAIEASVSYIENCHAARGDEQPRKGTAVKTC
jgi:hypothetical protein